jgi:hypothetical protein
MTSNSEERSICPALALGNAPPVQFITTAPTNQHENEAFNKLLGLLNQNKNNV